MGSDLAPHFWQIDAAEKRAEKAEQEYKANVKFFEGLIERLLGLGYEVQNTWFVRLRRFQLLTQQHGRFPIFFHGTFRDY